MRKSNVEIAAGEYSILINHGTQQTCTREVCELKLEL